MEEINICILPSNNTANLAIKLSQQLSKDYSTEFILNQNDFIPHISLYHVGIPTKNLNLVEKTIKNFSKKIKPFSIETINYKNVDTFLSWDIEKTKTLIDLQNQIINLINPLRENLLRKPIKDYIEDESLTVNQIENIKKFGYQFARESFDPHINITRFKVLNEAKKVAKSLSIIIKPIEVESLVVGLIGPHGTLPKILNTFKLKQ